MQTNVTPRKVSVTIEKGRQKRTYEGDYAYVGIMNEDGRGSRWEQEPHGWCGGQGLFFTGMEAMRTVAEEDGQEAFKCAARSVMDLLAIFDDSNPPELREEKRASVEAMMEKILGKNKAAGKKKKAAKGKSGEGEDE